MKNLPRRMWINQPSEFHSLHRLHGTNVVAVKEEHNSYRIYFLSGPVRSMRCFPRCLSEGWTGELDHA